jgi:hypothetical protein
MNFGGLISLQNKIVGTEIPSKILDSQKNMLFPKSFDQQ